MSRLFGLSIALVLPTFCVALICNLTFPCFPTNIAVLYSYIFLCRFSALSALPWDRLHPDTHQYPLRLNTVMHAVASQRRTSARVGRDQIFKTWRSKKKVCVKSLIQPKQPVASLPQQSVTLRRSRLAQVQDWFREEVGCWSWHRGSC